MSNHLSEVQLSPSRCSGQNFRSHLIFFLLYLTFNPRAKSAGSASKINADNNLKKLILNLAPEYYFNHHHQTPNISCLTSQSVSVSTLTTYQASSIQQPWGKQSISCLYSKPCKVFCLKSWMVFYGVQSPTQSGPNCLHSSGPPWNSLNVPGQLKAFLLSVSSAWNTSADKHMAFSLFSSKYLLKDHLPIIQFKIATPCQHSLLFNLLYFP